MTDDEIMIAFMQLMLEKKGWMQSIFEFSKNKSDDELRWIVLKERITSEGLVIDEGNHSYRLNDKGFSVMEKEGYKKWLKRKRKQEEKDEERKEFEHKLLKRQVQTFWLALVIGFLGGICGFIALVIELEPNNLQPPTQNQRVNTIDSISFSHQTKKVDSMPTPKIEIRH